MKSLVDKIIKHEENFEKMYAFQSTVNCNVQIIYSTAGFI